MLRRAVLAFCLTAFGLSLGCGSGEKEKSNNPNSLPYSTEGPPKREGGVQKKK